jgi:hypothetical protein
MPPVLRAFSWTPTAEETTTWTECNTYSQKSMKKWNAQWQSRRSSLNWKRSSLECPAPTTRFSAFTDHKIQPRALQCSLQLQRELQAARGSQAKGLNTRRTLKESHRLCLPYSGIESQFASGSQPSLAARRIEEIKPQMTVSCSPKGHWGQVEHMQPQI